MPAGQLTFDGREYLDGTASDPLILGWMQGSPPPAAKQVRFEDDATLGFPQNRWTLSHMRELVPTANVRRGSKTPQRFRRGVSFLASRHRRPLV